MLCLTTKISVDLISGSLENQHFVKFAIKTNLDTLDCTVHGAADLNRNQMSHVDCNDAESCLGYGHQLRDDDAQKCLECSKDGCAGILAGGADDDP